VRVVIVHSTIRLTALESRYARRLEEYVRARHLLLRHDKRSRVAYPIHPAMGFLLLQGWRSDLCVLMSPSNNRVKAEQI
jgi:hypothetical protein